MKLLILIALFGFVAVVSAKSKDCEVCEHIVKTAERHFHNGVKNELQLLRELQRECLRLVRHYGQNAAIHCDQHVTDHIGVIFEGVNEKKKPLHICIELGDCEGRVLTTPHPGTTGTGTPTANSGYTHDESTAGYTGFHGGNTGFHGGNTGFTIDGNTDGFTGFPEGTGTPRV